MSGEVGVELYLHKITNNNNNSQAALVCLPFSVE